MACFLDGVKCEGRVGISMLKRFYNKITGPEGSKVSPIMDDQRKQLKKFHFVLSKPFLGKGKGSDDNKVYNYQLNMTKFGSATLLEIVEGINTFQGRSRISNEVDKNPSILITSTHEPERSIMYEDAVNQIVNILDELKSFINDALKHTTFNGASVMDTPLNSLIADQPDPIQQRSRVPRTPLRGPAQNPFPDQAQASASASASNGGRRTKRRHTKCHHTKRRHTKRHHTKRTKRTKRSKHTKRRKH